MSKTDIEDAFWEQLHEIDGICGHCGKIECSGKKSNSILPNHIPITSLIETWRRIKGGIGDI